MLHFGLLAIEQGQGPPLPVSLPAQASHHLQQHVVPGLLVPPWHHKRAAGIDQTAKEECGASMQHYYATTVSEPHRLFASMQC